ncbi:hypothetical protein RB195_012320 [Necator americanus]|uniref:Uncharacterized protein n=1 Tax=Necator americanus TaxID=51031 RepID=A0ABR1D6I1_NECAM
MNEQDNKFYVIVKLLTVKPTRSTSFSARRKLVTTTVNNQVIREFGFVVQYDVGGCVNNREASEAVPIVLQQTPQHENEFTRKGKHYEFVLIDFDFPQMIIDVV